MKWTLQLLSEATKVMHQRHIDRFHHWDKVENNADQTLIKNAELTDRGAKVIISSFNLILFYTFSLNLQSLAKLFISLIPFNILLCYKPTFYDVLLGFYRIDQLKAAHERKVKE